MKLSIMAYLCLTVVRVFERLLYLGWLS